MDQENRQLPAYPPPAFVVPAPWNGKTNGFAIACLAMSIFGCVGLLAIVFGVIALRQTGRNGDRRGRVFAIIGLSICGLWLAAIAVAVVVNVGQGPDRDDTGAVRGKRSISVANLRPGDCIKDLENETGDYVDVVPCAQAHSSEVFATYALPPGPWAGDDKVKATAQSGCDDRFEGYAGVEPDTGSYVLFAAPPAKTDWPKDRDVLCIAHQLRATTTGTLRK